VEKLVAKNLWKLTQEKFIAPFGKIEIHVWLCQTKFVSTLILNGSAMI
jgi:hypothetical protein